ncbi:MAG: hypothetical protein HKN82_11830 [Akkermansiaceae bacterium]|nr:hypothetical protein [Akkermansiaceae bacterium]
MEPLHWILLLFGVLVAIAVIRNIRNPPRQIEWSDVPGELRNALRDSLAGFEVQTVTHVPVAMKYKLRGTYRGREGRAELECGPKGALQEIEYEDAAIGAVTRTTECQLTDLSPEAIAHVGELMGPERSSFQPSRVTAGTCADQPAFEVRGSSENWRWEIEITAGGRLIEMEKDVARGGAGPRPA